MLVFLMNISDFLNRKHTDHSLKNYIFNYILIVFKIVLYRPDYITFLTVTSGAGQMEGI